MNWRLVVQSLDRCCAVICTSITGLKSEAIHLNIVTKWHFNSLWMEKRTSVICTLLKESCNIKQYHLIKLQWWNNCLTKRNIIASCVAGNLLILILLILVSTRTWEVYESLTSKCLSDIQTQFISFFSENSFLETRLMGAKRLNQPESYSHLIYGSRIYWCSFKWGLNP